MYATRHSTTRNEPGGTLRVTSFSARQRLTVAKPGYDEAMSTFEANRSGDTCQMKMFALLCVLMLLLSQIGAPLTLGQVSLPAPKVAGPVTIISDPDVRVSYDGKMAHMEAYVAASVTNPDFLLAGGELIVPGRELGLNEARLYYSNDAGARWTPVLLPDEVGGGWDNAVAGGPEGTMYFLTSNSHKGLTVYRTADSGKTWASTVIEKTRGWDRPHIVVDVTTSSNRGRLYVAGESSDGVRVVSSADGGQTFTSQVTACVHRQGWNAATTASPVVLSDGTLIVPCAPYPDYPERAKWSSEDVGLVTSADGGRTFTPYHSIFTVHAQLPQSYFSARVHGDVLLSGNFMSGPSFAVAPPGALFADRLYAAWQDIDSSDRAQLLFAWSGDRGVTWSAPMPVDSPRAPGDKSVAVRQGVPMLAVNREGVVAVAWFDTRHDATGKGYDIYFAASPDGGRTFLPSVRISSATSRPAQGLGTLPSFRVGKPSAKGERVITMTSPFSSRATGGDYSTLTVDAAGRFHPLWADARDGAWQLYTSTVRVVPEKVMQELAETRTGPTPGTMTPCVLDSSHVQLLFGEPELNNTTSEVIVPVRLLNTSSAPMVEPINVQVTGAILRGNLNTYAPNAATLAPRLFDPANATFRETATFVYPISPRAPLFPNGVTRALIWRLHVAAPEVMDFTLSTTVSGGCSLAR